MPKLLKLNPAPPKVRRIYAITFLENGNQCTINHVDGSKKMAAAWFNREWVQRHGVELISVAVYKPVYTQIPLFAD